VRCSLGEVLDISAKGLRVRTRQNVPTGQIFAVTIDALDGPVSIPCFAPWRKRVGLFKYEVGICFVDISRHAATALNNLARSVAHNETIQPELKRFRKSA
jgi:PilZ domain